ncbi:hypothetical protein F4810DRAFT_414229 [Camillea tinctor]|nr:hypothetical protein F4810DRAFT_414229 [Camillea tinctor]
MSIGFLFLSSGHLSPSVFDSFPICVCCSFPLSLSHLPSPPLFFSNLIHVPETGFVAQPPSRNLTCVMRELSWLKRQTAVGTQQDAGRVRYPGRVATSRKAYIFAKEKARPVNPNRHRCGLTPAPHPPTKYSRQYVIPYYGVGVFLTLGGRPVVLHG